MKIFYHISTHIIRMILNYLYEYLKSNILINQHTKAISLAIDEFSEIRCRNVELITKDNKNIYGWFLSPLNIDKDTEFCLYLHGNRHNRKTFCESYNVENIVKTFNLSLFIIDYHDFGDSQGEFTKEMIKYDVDVALQFMSQFITNKNVHLIGYSLGTGILVDYLKELAKNNINGPKLCFQDEESKYKIDEGINLHKSKMGIKNFIKNIFWKRYKNTNLNKFKTIPNLQKEIIFLEKTQQIDHQLVFNSQEDDNPVCIRQNILQRMPFYDDDFFDYLSSLNNFFKTKDTFHYRANGHQNKIKGKIILLAPYTSILKLVNMNKKFRLATLFLPILKRYVTKHFNFDTLENGEHLDTKNTKIFHGSLDIIISKDMSIEISRKFLIELEIISNCDHTSVMQDHYVWEQIINYLNY